MCMIEMKCKSGNSYIFRIRSLDNEQTARRQHAVRFAEQPHAVFVLDMLDKMKAGDKVRRCRRKAGQTIECILLYRRQTQIMTSVEHAIIKIDPHGVEAEAGYKFEPFATPAGKIDGLRCQRRQSLHRVEKWPIYGESVEN